MSQKFSEPIKDRRRLPVNSLPAAWASYSARILPKEWKEDQRVAAEIFFFTGAAFAYQLLVTKAEASGGPRNAAANVLADLSVWVKRRKKASGFHG